MASGSILFRSHPLDKRESWQRIEFVLGAFTFQRVPNPRRKVKAGLDRRGIESEPDQVEKVL
jgi:hypothetical protein